MNGRANRSWTIGFSVRAVTLILPVLLFMAPANLFAGEKVSEDLQEKMINEKLNKLITDPDHSKTLGAEAGRQKKMGYNFGVEDATGHGEVRASKAKVGVDYKMSQNATVGVEASRGIHDSQDAAAWGRSVEDENAAKAKYKLSF